MSFKKLALSTLLAVVLLLTCITGLALLRQPKPYSEEDKPKVLITNFHLDYSGGHLTYINNLLTGPLSEQYTMALAAPSSSDIYKRTIQNEKIAIDVEFPCSLKEISNTIKAFFEFYKICLDYKPNIIHTNGGHDNTIASWAALFLPKRPAIIRTFHATKKIGKDPYHWLLYNHLVHERIFTSRLSCDYNTQNNGLPIRNAVIIENGVNLNRYKPRPFNTELAKKLNIKESDFIFGSCAGLSSYKRVDLILQAAASLKEDYSFKILVVGHEDRGKALQEQAKALGLENIFIYGGYTQDVRPYNSLFKVGFILSDQVETISYAAREMMAMGIPLISSSYSGLKDNIDNLHNGILVEPGNLKELQTSMKYFLDLDQNELEEYQTKARSKAEKSFSIQKQWHGIASTYAHALQRPSNTTFLLSTPNLAL